VLEASGLPLAGAAEHLQGFLVAAEGETILGCVALEQYGPDGLLRSVAVASQVQGQGLGQALVQAAIARAHRDGLRTLTLLTTTAGAFFPRFGFRAIDRAAAPPIVQASVEFQEACPASATVMLLDMTEGAETLSRRSS
jgi:amino-acid N-acetyltransferase